MAYKVYYQGRRIDGRYAPVNHFFRKVWHWCKVTASCALIGGIIYTAGFLTAASNKAEASNTVIDSMPARVEVLKGGVLDAVSNCEVPGYKAGDAPIILDTNARMSIGPYMFQVATVQQYEKSLYGKDVTRLEATNIALDKDAARALAKDIIFKAGGIGNWYNCMNKHDLDAKVNLIQSLEK